MKRKTPNSAVVPHLNSVVGELQDDGSGDGFGIVRVASPGGHESVHGAGQVGRKGSLVVADWDGDGVQAGEQGEELSVGAIACGGGECDSRAHGRGRGGEGEGGKGLNGNTGFEDGQLVIKPEARVVTWLKSNAVSNEPDQGVSELTEAATQAA